MFVQIIIIMTTYSSSVSSTTRSPVTIESSKVDSKNSCTSGVVSVLDQMNSSEEDGKSSILVSYDSFYADSFVDEEVFIAEGNVITEYRSEENCSCKVASLKDSERLTSFRWSV